MKNIFPWVRHLPERWVIGIATVGRIGFWGRAPGTVGSVIGLLWYTVFFFNLEPFHFFALLLFSLYIAVAFCDEAERVLRRHDPPCAILDEVVAMPICFLGLRPAMEFYQPWVILLGGFLLFRFFDILKPLGIKKLQHLPGGWGIVIDDVVAALATCLCLHLLLRLPYW